MYLLLSLLMGCSGHSTNGSVITPAAYAQANDPRALSLTTLQGDPFPAETLEGKVTLFVNVASECGYTGQYEGLQGLYEKYKTQGLVIVGVPCNQFGGQEPGSPVEIATFCKKNFGVTFPLLEKQDINGANRSPLYTTLINSPNGKGRNVFWNFEKFLVGKDGVVIERFGTNIKPNSSKLVTAIEAAL